MPGGDNEKAGFRGRYLDQLMNVFTPENIRANAKENEAFSFLRFADSSVEEASTASQKDIFSRAVDLAKKPRRLAPMTIVYDEEEEKNFTPAQAMLQIVERNDRKPLAEVTHEGYLNKLFNIAKDVFADSGLSRVEQCGRPAVTAPPIEVFCASRGAVIEKENV